MGSSLAFCLPVNGKEIPRYRLGARCLWPSTRYGKRYSRSSDEIDGGEGKGQFLFETLLDFFRFGGFGEKFHRVRPAPFSGNFGFLVSSDNLSHRGMQDSRKMSNMESHHG